MGSWIRSRASGKNKVWSLLTGDENWYWFLSCTKCAVPASDVWRGDWVQGTRDSLYNFSVNLKLLWIKELFKTQEQEGPPQLNLVKMWLTDGHRQPQLPQESKQKDPEPSGQTLLVHFILKMRSAQIHENEDLRFATEASKMHETMQVVCSILNKK